MLERTVWLRKVKESDTMVKESMQIARRRSTKMYKEEFSRTALLLGEDAIDRLAQCRVAVFGVGGVGGYVCEALARCGIGHLDLFDSDVVSI